MFCHRNGISLQACSEMISQPLVEVMKRIKESATCIAGNYGKGCELFILAAHVLPLLKFSIQDAEIVDSHLQGICIHSFEMCPSLTRDWLCL